MIKISTVIIAKNAEQIIADCLDSVSFCNEIIVVDNNSEDRTTELAEKMGAKVYESSSVNFSELRNYGLRKTLGEWILYIDADERVSENLQKNIKLAINTESNEIVAYKVKRKNFYFGKHEWPYIEHLERLFKKKNLIGWYGKLHESPKFEGEFSELDGLLLHFTHADLVSMVDKTVEWSKIEAELRYNSGHPKMTWWRFPRVMMTAFFNSYVKQKGWKAGTAGLVESMYQAFSVFITYARLWEMQQKNQKSI